MKLKTKTFLPIFAIFATLFASANALSVTKDVSPTVLYEAVDVLTDYLNEDLSEISSVAKKVAVMNYTQSEDLPASLKAYVLKKLEKASQETNRSPVRIMQCMKCLSIRAEAQGDEIFIKKGITTKEELAAAMKEMNVRKYADVNITNAGRYLVMQMAIKDKDNVVSWAEEYKTPINSYADSQWLIGADVQAVSFGDAAFPSPQAAHIYFGQRIFGIGAAGMSIQMVQKTDELEAISTYAAFLELNHNEIFSQYWGFFNLNYLVELGITDFNDKQQLSEVIGIKTKFGNHFAMRLAYQVNQFIQKPKDSSDIYNPKGKSLLKNNEPLPGRILLGVGVEI